MQCGNPGDAFWKGFAGAGGSPGNVNGKPMPDYRDLLKRDQPAQDLLDKCGIPERAWNVDGTLANRAQGHLDPAFNPDMSFLWGIFYLLWGLRAPQLPKIDCGSLDTMLPRAARRYNGNPEWIKRNGVEGPFWEVEYLPKLRERARAIGLL